MAPEWHNGQEGGPREGLRVGSVEKLLPRSSKLQEMLLHLQSEVQAAGGGGPDQAGLGPDTDAADPCLRPAQAPVASPRCPFGVPPSACTMLVTSVV